MILCKDCSRAGVSGAGLFYSLRARDLYVFQAVIRAECDSVNQSARSRRALLFSVRRRFFAEAIFPGARLHCGTNKETAITAQLTAFFRLHPKCL